MDTPSKNSGKPWVFLLEDKQYNASTYDGGKSVCQVSVELSRVFEKVFATDSPDEKASTDEQFSTYHLIQTAIDTVSLIENFNNPFPVVEVKYRDQTMGSLKYINDGYSKITFCVKRTESDKETQNDIPTITEDFIVNRNDIIDFTPEGIDITIGGVSTKQILWQSHFYYASKKKDKPKPISTILNEYLTEFSTKSKSKIQYTNFNAQSSTQSTEKSTTNSEATLDTYVTPVNTTVKNNVDALLLLSASESMGIFFVKYDCLLRTLSLVSLNQIYSSSSITSIKSHNIFLLPTATLSSLDQATAGKDAGFPGREIIASVVKTYSSIGGTMVYDTLTSVKKNQFDSSKRKWQSSTISDTNISNYMPKSEELNTALKSSGGTQTLPSTGSAAQAIEFENTLKGLPKEIKDLMTTCGLFTIETTSNSQFIVGSKVDTLFKNFEIVEFVAGGNLQRTTGDLIVLSTTSNVEEQYLRLAGVWLVLSLVSNFRSTGAYTQTVYAIRPSHVKIDMSTFEAEKAFVSAFEEVKSAMNSMIGSQV